MIPNQAVPRVRLVEVKHCQATAKRREACGWEPPMALCGRIEGGMQWLRIQMHRH